MKSGLQVAITSLLVCVIALASFGCRTGPGSREFDEIELLPESERFSKFASYPMNVQIDIFLDSQKNPYGKSHTYQGFMVQTGAADPAPIVKRIESENDIWHQSSLIWVLEIIDEKCSCVSSNPDYLSRLRKVETTQKDTDPESVRISKRFYEAELKILESRRDR